VHRLARLHQGPCDTRRVARPTGKRLAIDAALIEQAGRCEASLLLKIVGPQRGLVGTGGRKGNVRGAVGSRGHHEAVVVVHVFAEQVDPARCARNGLARLSALLEYPGDTSDVLI
jgi:hypothetical protein